MKDRAIFIGKMKASMLRRRGEMLGMLTQLANDKASDGQVQDSGDEALSISMEHLQSSLQQTDMDEIRLIDGALDRISKQEYGVCIECGNPIPEKRLENFPYAARCVACQEKLEL